jgi:thiol-disulfide isomerase/thioredoxin
MKHVLTLVFVCLSVLGWSQRAKQIEITVTGLQQGTLVNLIGVYAESNFRADTALVEANGRFVFRRDTGYVAGFYYVLLPDGKTSFQILLDTEPVVTLKTTQTAIVKDMVVTGSLDNQLLYENLKFQEALEPRGVEITAKLKAALPGTPEYVKVRADFELFQTERAAHIESFRTRYPNALFTKFKLSGQNPVAIEPKKADGVTVDTAAQIFAYRAAFWKDMDFADVRMIRTPVYFNKMKRFIKELTPQNQDSIIKSADWLIEQSLANPEVFKFTLNWILLQYKAGTSEIMAGDDVYSYLIEKYWTNERAYWSNPKEVTSLRQQAKQMRGSLLNAIGQDVKAKDFDGNYRSLYDLKAKYLVVYIYNPNCEHCQEQTPELWKLYQTYNPAGLLDVYSIVTTTTREEWGAYRQKVGYKWTDVYDTDPYESKWPLKYHVDITPEVYLLDPDRRIIAKNINVEQVEEVIRRDRTKRGI